MANKRWAGLPTKGITTQDVRAMQNGAQNMAKALYDDAWRARNTVETLHLAIGASRIITIRNGFNTLTRLAQRSNSPYLLEAARNAQKFWVHAIKARNEEKREYFINYTERAASILKSMSTFTPRGNGG